MVRVIIGLFFVLHGLVHLLYLGQSRKLFELQHGLVWPDGSWAFSRLLGNDTTRIMASIALGLAAFGFVIGGAGIFIRQEWWRPVVISSALFSAVIFLLLWDGERQKLDEKGAIGILINLVILIALFLLRWQSS